jgi:hypothetical protein
VSPEVLVLGLTTVLRPSTVAAVYAMLAARRPQRLLLVYTATGLVFSVGLGVTVVLAFAGAGGPGTRTTGRAVLDVVLGAAALGYAAGAWSGRLAGPRAAPAGESWLQRRLRHLTPSVAALAGVLTHLPGLVYLAALNAVIAGSGGPVDSVVQVLVYNALWFSLPIVALVLSVRRPEASRDLLERGTAWAARHRRVIVVTFTGVLGAYLVVKGVLELSG